MIDANKRILIVDDEKRGYHAAKRPGIIRSRDYFIENHYAWIIDGQYEWNQFDSKILGIDTNLNITIQNKSVNVNMGECFSLHRDSYGPLWLE